MNPIEFQFRPLDKWPRDKTDDAVRRSAPFNTAGRYVTDPNRLGQENNKKYVSGRPTPVGRSYEQLEKELAHLGAASPVVIEVAMKAAHIRKDGLPKTDAPRPAFPGVIVSFKSKAHGPLRFACDDCKRWEDNLRAIVLTMERLRLADLYGVTKSGEQYKGWRALPAPLVTPSAMTVREAASVLAAIDDTSGAGEIEANGAAFKEAYRAAARKYHPDANGGSVPSEWTKIQEAKGVLEAHHGGN